SLDLALSIPADLHPAGTDLSFQARLRLEGEPPLELDPLDVFRVSAGLSSSRLPSASKKAHYGLAFLVVERIVERRGIAGLRQMCRAARREACSPIALSELLSAPGLDEHARDWRTAIESQIGPEELRELVRMHPQSLLSTLDEFFGPYLSAEP